MMAKVNPAQFIRQVKQEAAKVTWPTGKEVRGATFMVFVFCTLAAVFLMGVDFCWKHIIGKILGLWGV